MDITRKMAVLIDAENISSKYVKTVLDEATNNGNIIFKRIYGNWTNNQMKTWKEVILESSILPVQQYSNTTGKNSSDSAMIIDAMDLLYTNKIDGFCIVSSDSDFTRLATRLRESEMFVFGMGELKTPKSFINACDKFSYLDILYAEEHPQKSAEKQDSPKQPTLKEAAVPAVEKENKSAKTSQGGALLESGADAKSIKRAIKMFIDEQSDDDGWLFSGRLGTMLGKRFPDFDSRNFGFKKLIPFVESLGNFEIKRVPSDEDANVNHVYVKNKA